MTVRLSLVSSEELAPFVPGLRALEESISYPVEGDRFTIDHGAHYAAFFAEMGAAYFLLAHEEERVLGVLAGVLRQARLPSGVLVSSGYACDFKLHPSVRGTGLARTMVFEAFKQALFVPRFRTWSLAYGAAMRGERGDVMRSMRGINPAKLVSSMAVLSVYFVPLPQLASLSVLHAPMVSSEKILDLSPTARTDAPEGWCTTAGRKDLRLCSSGRPWPLVHLPWGPALWSASHAAYLRESALLALRKNPDGIACFAIDQRSVAEQAFLERQGLLAGATCTVYGLAKPGVLRERALVHLATSEI